MINLLSDQMVKQTLLYGFIFSAPFLTFTDISPSLQNNQLLNHKELTYGDHSEAVHVLQQKLADLAYYPDKIDGEFDILTEHAIKKFQRDHHVHVSGQTDIQTIYALIDSETKKYKKDLDSLSGSIYPGLHNKDVKVAQKILHYFGYYEGEIDSIYGPLTQKAIESAEVDNGFEVVDEVNPQTLKALYRDLTSEQLKGQNTPTTNTAKNEIQPERQDETKQSKKQTNHKQAVKHAQAMPSNQARIIKEAKSYRGVPYVWGGDSPDGFDCSGYIQYVYQQKNIKIPRTVHEIWNFASPVKKPSVGDLVFFATYQKGPSHMGIYIGDGEFIHAGESRGVEISKMSNTYWQDSYLGAKRIR